MHAYLHLALKKRQYWISSELYHLVSSRKPGDMNLLLLSIYVEQNFKRCHIINPFVQWNWCFSRQQQSSVTEQSSCYRWEMATKGSGVICSQALPLRGFMGVPGHLQNRDWSQSCKMMIRKVCSNVKGLDLSNHHHCCSVLHYSYFR